MGVGQIRALLLNLSFKKKKKKRIKWIFTEFRKSHISSGPKEAQRLSRTTPRWRRRKHTVYRFLLEKWHKSWSKAHLSWATNSLSRSWRQQQTSPSLKSSSSPTRKCPSSSSIVTIQRCRRDFCLCSKLLWHDLKGGWSDQPPLRASRGLPGRARISSPDKTANRKETTQAPPTPQCDKDTIYFSRKKKKRKTTWTISQAQRRKREGWTWLGPHACLFS